MEKELKEVDKGIQKNNKIYAQQHLVEFLKLMNLYKHKLSEDKLIELSVLYTGYKQILLDMKW